MATIYDVAREAGVSRSTVSRVINGKKEVNEETRRIVEEAMRRLDYRPNASARALASQKSYTLGVVSVGLTDPFYSSMIGSIYHSADELGYGTLFCVNNLGKQTKVDYFNILFGKVDGIIFVGENTVSYSELVRLVNAAYPVVLIENNMNIPEIISVNIDNFQGAYNATRYLIQLGHKKIAHMMGRKSSFEAADRLKGYTQALKDYGITMDAGLVKEGHYLFNNAYQCSKELLDERRDVTAIFCANDIMAAAFMHAAMERGLKVPDDISVVGFDDIKDSDLFLKEMPLLTTVRQPRRELAAYAVKTLVGKIERKEKGENKVFNTELVVRESTAEIK